MISWLTVGWAATALATDPEREISTKVPAALEYLRGWEEESPERAERKLHLVYWTPKDREPAPRYRQRLTAIMEDIRDFYAAEMKRIGFGPRTINLDYGDDGLLDIHLARGRKEYAAYDVDSGGEIRNESLPTLRAAGLDPERETVVIFCNMSNWDAERSEISQNSPYYAGGSHRQGTAWQVDSPILELSGLEKTEPNVRDGQYGRISIGRYNSIFIGGICHELGHALGLPHNAARPEESDLWGTALMGSGNRTYGEDRRGDGPGSFLTLAHALRLASHPMFSGSVKGMNRDAEIGLTELEVEPHGESFTVTGRVTGTPAPYAVIGYMDPEGGGDYDATTCTAIPDADGRFALVADAHEAGAEHEFRLVTCQVNGACSSYAGSGGRWSIPYTVDDDGRVDLSLHQSIAALRPLVARVNAGDAEGAREALGTLRESDAGEQVLAAGRALCGTLDDAARPVPAEFERDRLVLSRAEPAHEEVGWGRPAYDRLPEPAAVIVAGGKLRARGVYAHAPAEHRWDLGGKWRTFSGSAGLPAGKSGSCEFVIMGDGEALWSSSRVEEGRVADFSVDVSDVETLKLRVGEAGDGSQSDWGYWFDPVLTR